LPRWQAGIIKIQFPLNSGYTVLNEAAVNFSYGVSKTPRWVFKQHPSINFKVGTTISHNEPKKGHNFPLPMKRAFEEY
jgi:hypothetical protein